MTTIRAGTEQELKDLKAAEWLFVDIGFSAKKKTCGSLAVAAGGDWKKLPKPEVQTFAELKDLLRGLVQGNQHTSPLNLVLEAPLSVAYDKKGNPCGRNCELRIVDEKKKTRYWYVGLGCTVLLASQLLLKVLRETTGNREVRLFEGLVSFKKKKNKSDHKKDVKALAKVVHAKGQKHGGFVKPKPLADQGTIESIGNLLSLTLGVPIVVEVKQ